MPWLRDQGYQATYGTPGGRGERASGDIIVDRNGNTYDLLVDSDGDNPSWGDPHAPLGKWEGGQVMGPDGPMEWDAWLETLSDQEVDSLDLDRPLTDAERDANAVLNRPDLTPEQLEKIKGWKPINPSTILGGRPAPSWWNRATPLIQTVNDRITTAREQLYSPPEDLKKSAATSNDDPFYGDDPTRRASSDYAAAGLAGSRQRKKAAAGGRRSTILGGFAAGRPSTRAATILGA